MSGLIIIIQRTERLILMAEFIMTIMVIIENF